MLKIYSVIFFTVLSFSVAAQSPAAADSQKIEDLDKKAAAFIQANSFDSAMKYKLNLIEFSKSIKGNSEWLRQKKSSSLQTIVRIYLNMGMPEQAITYLDEQREFIAPGKELAFYYKNKSDALRFLAQANVGTFEASRAYYDSLGVMCSSGEKNACYNIIAMDLSYADYFTTKKDNANAVKYVEHANLLAPKWADTLLQSQVGYIAGNTYKEAGEYSRALPYLLKAEPFAKEWDENLYTELLRSIAQCYGKLNNYQKAYEYYEKFAPLRDSIYVKAAQQSFAEMEATYQNKNKQQKIDVLSAENTIKNLKIKNAARQKIYFILGLGLLGIIIASILVIYRNKQKSSRLLQQKNDEMNLLNESLEKANSTKAKLFSIISHDLRSPISQVYQFLDLQKNSPEMFSEADKQKHNERISAAAGVVLETMEDLLIWSKTQMQQFSETIENVHAKEIVDNVSDLLGAQFAKKEIVLRKEIPENLFLHTDKNILAIILRNLLQNACTYSPEKSAIIIEGKKETGATLFTIQDEGAGMPENVRSMFNESEANISSNSSGLGLTLVKEMAEIIKADIKISGESNAGTKITISIPERN
jgi:signal transduction histidine kinase